MIKIKEMEKILLKHEIVICEENNIFQFKNTNYKFKYRLMHNNNWFSIIGPKNTWINFEEINHLERFLENEKKEYLKIEEAKLNLVKLMKSILLGAEIKILKNQKLFIGNGEVAFYINREIYTGKQYYEGMFHGRIFRQETLEKLEIEMAYFIKDFSEKIKLNILL